MNVGGTAEDGENRCSASLPVPGAVLNMEGLLLQCAAPASEPGRVSPAYASFFAKQFFVSWCGVLTLVYTGFPQPLLNLKNNLSSSCHSIAPENPGSRWPKTSLAAVNDEASSINKEQLLQLHEICKAANFMLTATAADQIPIHFDSFSYVHFQNRCLSNRFLKLAIPLQAAPGTTPAHDQGVPTVQNRQLDAITRNEGEVAVCNVHVISPSVEASTWPPLTEIQNTDQVVQQAEDPEYWRHVAKPGSRRSHYILPASGTTLCCFLADTVAAAEQKQRLLDCIESFKTMVQAKFPGLYCFFPTDSLHITIRGIS